MKLLKFFKWSLFFIIILFSSVVFAVYLITYHPRKIETLKVSNKRSTPLLEENRKIKVMSWNIQYLAGKNYLFFYDLLDGSGPDTRPSSEDLHITLNEVARVINSEEPDIIMLQEVDDHSKRTDNKDQLRLLLQKIFPNYISHVSAFYWKAAFVPHPKIMGNVGVKLSIISKFPIESAKRYSLPLMPGGWLVQQFNLKRAMLETVFRLKSGRKFVCMTTHLDAFAQGTDTMEKQVALIKNHLLNLKKEEIPWIISGDFNLLAPGQSYSRLNPPQQAYFNEESELSELSDNFEQIPSLSDINGPDYKKWFTHFPNDPAVKAPDRTIDFYFVSPLIKVMSKNVRQKDTLAISDHLPLITTIEINE